MLRLAVDGPTYDVAGEGAVPAIEAVAIHDSAMGSVTVFAVNRVERPLRLELTLRDLDGLAVVEHRVLADPDIHASNAAAHSDRVVPRWASGAVIRRGQLLVTLQPRSWNMIRLSGGEPDRRSLTSG